MPAATPPSMSSALPASPAELPLRDIHLPEAVSWWPPAPGWWFLLALLLTTVIGVWFYRRYHHRRRALYSLQQHMTEIRQLQADGDALDIIEQVSILLRRACLSFYPRSDVASLTGDDWITFLNDRTDNSFTDELRTLLTVAPYRKPEDIDRHEITQLIDTVEQQLPHLFVQAGK